MRPKRSVLVLLAFALALGPAATALGTSASFDVRNVAEDPLFGIFDQQAPDLNGRHLAYESRNVLDFGSKYKVYVYDRVTGETTGVASSVGNQTNADVWNGLVVYEDDSAGNKDVRIYDLRSRSGSVIANGAGDQKDPRIQDGVVVWHGGTNVYFRNLRSGVSHQVPAGTGSQGNLGTSRGYVYYQDDDGVSFDVYRYDHAWIETECISGDLSGNGNWAGDLAVHDDTVMWRGSRFEWPETAIRAYDVRSGIESTAATNLFEREQPDVFGQAFTYVDDIGGNLGVRAKVEGWSAGSVLMTTTPMEDPSIYGNSVAFSDGADIWLGEHPATTVRLAGIDRYATTAEISARHFSRSGWVVLASGENWPDALSASGLAGALDCPLLLVRKDSVPLATAQEIARLGATNFMLIGGTGAVSAAVFESFQDDYGEFAIQRVGGHNRYATAAQVAQWVVDLTDMEPFNSTWFGAALIVSGESYADALAAAPLSAAQHMPILLVRQSELPTDTAAELSNDYYKSALYIGGTGAISLNVQEEADAFIAPNPGSYESGRWWGADRYATAAEVALNSMMLRLLDPDAIGLATGTEFADALGAGAALGSYGSPILLTRPGSLPAPTADFLTDWTYDVGELQIMGGTAAVNASVMTSAAARLSP